jgi:glucose-6-phosphate isomerase, archaeal
MSTSHEGLKGITAPKVFLDWSGSMTGAEIKESSKTVGDLHRIFRDAAQGAGVDSKEIVYRVQWWAPVNPGVAGGLFWGVTAIEPGKVGDEYFMTHGHFHADRTRAEYYGTVSGKGMLIRMDEDRKTWGEEMSPGSLHYIDGRHAHRVANTGDEPLIFWASWPSDAGYDYATIAERGFGSRLISKEGRPEFIPNA